MSILSRFHILAALMVVLAFGIPLATLAQQKAAQTEIFKISAEQDANAVNLDAKAAAEQDASNAINNLLWFSAGLGFAYAGSVGGWIAGSMVDGRILSDSDFLPLPGPGAVVGVLLGGIAGVVAETAAIEKSTVHVPTERLIGKSPEYVESYTDAYQRKIRSLRANWAVAGAASGCALPIIGCLLVLMNSR